MLNNAPWRRDSNETAPDEPGAVQTEYGLASTSSKWTRQVDRLPSDGYLEAFNEIKRGTICDQKCRKIFESLQGTLWHTNGTQVGTSRCKGSTNEEFRV